MSVIDLGKIQSSMDHFVDRQEGRNSLLAFRESIETLRGSMPTKPNDAEFLYVLQRLVGQMRPHDLNQAGPADGSLSDQQLKAVAGGAGRSNLFNAAGVTRLGDFRSIGNLGFRILTNVV